jgi:hypothetical protein
LKRFLVGEPSAACLQEGDEAFVEQKNGAVLRRLSRFDGVETPRVMARLYAAAGSTSASSSPHSS